jgi:tetratricopeptide (TPR) repeat protein
LRKINSYFSQIEKPFVIIFDSFEAILDENRTEILDFIFHLVSMQKVKVILIGRSFESKYFQDIKLERITNLAFEKKLFEKFLKAEKIKFSGTVLEEFYKYTRGYYFFTAFSVKLMQNQNISLAEFLTNLKNSFLPFHKFLEKQGMTLITPAQRSLFWFLCLIRHPVSLDLLKKINFFDEESINFLINNLVIINDGSEIYVQDYLKEEIEDYTSGNILQKIRRYIIDLYSTQLPLKPLERDICISRQTMRKEIEFHKFFLPKRPKNIANQQDVNYLSYSKVLEFNEKSKIDSKEKKEDIKETQNKKIDLTQRKNISINLENLPFQNTDNQPSFEEEEKILGFNELVNLIKKSSKNYQYAMVIELCQKALLMRDDKEYQVFLPLIYTKLAYAYQKIANYENALKYYESALDFYKKAENFIKVNHIKFNLARIFYETYRSEKAKELFFEIANAPDSPSLLIVKSYIQLANLEEDSALDDNSIKYYKLALKHVNELVDTEVLSELYFKYALIMDDKNDVITAIEFYNKCINLSEDSNVNKFLSPSYSNIATLYLEKNKIENAVLNYIKSYEIDKKNNNLEGMYYSASKLASVLQKKQPQKALEYFNTALYCAKEINDIFYIISASLAIGDYYYDVSQNEIALKYYIQALDMAQTNLSKDNIYKINTRINDIKFRLGVEKFDKLAEIIREQFDE